MVFDHPGPLRAPDFFVQILLYLGLKLYHGLVAWLKDSLDFPAEFHISILPTLLKENRIAGPL